MLQVDTVPAFSDNYIWLILDPSRRHAAIVDPGDARPVIAHCEAHGITPDAILITHFHSDHVGGIAGLRDRWPELPVYGPAGETIPQRSVALREGDRVALATQGIEFAVWDVPGHTAGHIAYVGAGAVFCGDTLFACGCGRVFTGTHAQLHASLARLRALPDETRVYCAHEYTLDNIGFARWVEPDSAALQARERDDWARIDADRPTVPSTMAIERATNPFLRFDEPGVIAAAARYRGRSLAGPAEVFHALRDWKDREYD